MKRIPDPLLRMRNWSYYLEQDDLAKKKRKKEKKKNLAMPPSTAAMSKATIYKTNNYASHIIIYK